MGCGIIVKMCKTAGEDNSREGTCNKVVVKETHEHFAFMTKVKEVINPQTILKVLESDFAECSAQTEPYSAEDSRFLNILENGIVKTPVGHYQMPLSLKSDLKTVSPFQPRSSCQKMAPACSKIYNTAQVPGRLSLVHERRDCLMCRRGASRSPWSSRWDGELCAPLRCLSPEKTKSDWRCFLLFGPA